MLTETTLRAWTPGATTTASRDVVVVDKTTGEKRVSTKKGDAIPDRKRADRDGMYAVMAETGTISFRYDYRIHGRRETLTIGRYDSTLPAKTARDPADLVYGMSLNLLEARALLARARRQVEQGESPSRAKVEKRNEAADALTFGGWATRYFAFRADPASGALQLADSTLAMRKATYARVLEGPLGKLKLEEITPRAISDLCSKIKAERGPGPAIHAREIVLVVFNHAIDSGVDVENPAQRVRPSSIATFAVRDRKLTRHELRTFFEALETTPTLPTLRLALRFMFLTGVRKSEFIDATWREIDWEKSQWVIPKERMKAGREHVVPLSSQAIDILETLHACFSASKYLHPGRYESDIPISNATLNRVIDATVKRINDALPEDAVPFASFSVHDLRRTMSTRLNEAGFDKSLIEAALAHAEKDKVAAAYNHSARLAARRVLMQAWADMLDCWVKGESAVEVLRASAAKMADAAVLDVEAEVDL